VALRWLLYVQLNLAHIVKTGTLQVADDAMGNGPFEINLKRYKCKFKIAGPGCLNGIREMYVRDVYLSSGWLSFKPNDTVLDLGANMGNFTNMALAMEPTLRVIAVEPSIKLNSIFEKSVGLNAGYLARTTLIRAILGDPCEAIIDDADYAGADFLSEDQLLDMLNLPKIDFIKCDIEGGEFKLLGRRSKLLLTTRALACEAHAKSGDIPNFLLNVEASGLNIGPMRYSQGGQFLVFLAKRPA
jgi:hypothetical protein